MECSPLQHKLLQMNVALSESATTQLSRKAAGRIAPQVVGAWRMLRHVAHPARPALIPSPCSPVPIRSVRRANDPGRAAATERACKTGNVECEPAQARKPVVHETKMEGCLRARLVSYTKRRHSVSIRRPGCAAWRR